jgi:hypothetical protein
MTDLDTVVRRLTRELPESVDDLPPGATAAAADVLADAGVPAPALATLEHRLLANPNAHALHLAVKVARARRFVLDRAEPFHLSVVFAVYREHERIRTPEEHPLGEDFLRRKIAQLRWLLDDRTRGTWDLTVVDDGCPEGSGRIVREVLDGLDEPVDARVLFLADAIRDGHPATVGLGSVDDSRKGGSIHLGLWEAAAPRGVDHVVLFTDADLSTHLGQAGRLLEPVLDDGAGGADAAIGSRREETSVVVKTGVRNLRGKLFIYLWKRLLPALGEIVDTQCGFKAWRADVVREVIDGAIEKGFAFDVEMLLRTLLRRPGSIEKVPLAWFDSEAASTTTDLDPYLSMLRSIVAVARRYAPPTGEGDAFARFVDGLDEERWHRLVENVPAVIEEREPVEFGTFSGVSVEDLERIATT